ncbi:ECF RNA polymerase sigma-E factor [Phycisphaerae bacterium RAS1]|nr:ECF RNA polymerase sigma-E factor [Phycisphaerae bacterium RAS1]
MNAASANASELGLIHAAVNGDGQAFAALVSLYGPRLRWLIDLRLPPTVRARVSGDDVLQEVLLTVSQQIRALLVENEAAFWTWLCKVVEQRLIDVRRRHLQAAVRDARREAPLASPGPGSTSVRLGALLADSGTSPSGRLRSHEQREALRAALGELPESYREVIVLRILEGLSVSDTATIMGRSPGAVSVLLTKAVKRLGSVIAADRSGVAPGDRAAPPQARQAGEPADGA